ncbi:ribose transport system substrate-binding protein [Gracilibacillus orientalis]|uniref:Ribose transport system substrate-binding protein n=1 Tax=Gracilibacillus orientalis TaxID=334253 RepID=A0A1I4PFR0_9BACI|nr:substrate-binding domain-containing protein [Gracilibacillus orientalis]SFM26632.1 ribose transport system substrate-binding protein [Gracilibacillus orientalis]
MVRKIFFTILFLIPFCLMLYYGKETFYIDQQAATQEMYDYHFALVTEEVGNNYWHFIEKGAKQAAEEHNVYLEYVGPKVTDTDERLDTLDRMIAANVDAIITKGMSDPRFRQLVQKAKEHQIPVATIDTDNSGSGRDFYVGTDNFEAGYLAGKTMIEETEGEQKVVAIIGLKDAQNQMERLEGFEEAISQEERIELVAVAESNITELGAADATYQLLKSRSDITAIFGISALDGMGIVQAIDEFQPTTRPYVLAFDILPETLELIEDDKIQATIAQYPEEMGKMAVKEMYQLHQKDQPENIHHTKTGVIKKEDVMNGEVFLKEGE